MAIHRARVRENARIVDPCSRYGDATPTRTARHTPTRDRGLDVARAMEAYRNKFIATGKFAPLKHFMVRARRDAREGSFATRTFE